VRDASNTILFSFDAVGVKAAGKDELAVAAPPVGGRSNIYLIELPGGSATFVASALPGSGNWPFSASADAILWTDGYCNLQQPGPITYFDRNTGQLVRVDSSTVTNPGTDIRWVQLRPDGRIAAGDFGASYLIDPATLAYVTVIPAGPTGGRGNVSWSDGYRYASHGPYGGHGGSCVG